MELTTEEIAKVFSLYGPCEAIAYKRHGIIESVNYSEATCGLGYEIDDEESGFYGEWETEIFDLNKTKLKLTPLPKITDEHAIEVGTLRGLNAPSVPTENLIEMVMGMLDNRKLEELPLPIYLYLIHKGYAVPLWFGIDHWANAQSAIQLGIAIESAV